MKAIEITKGVYWVGAIDWNIRDYHGYTLPGTTYNAYLVVGDKIALIDSAYPGFDNQILERIRSVVDPKKIDYLIANHVEKDHSGTLPALTKLLPGAPVYCTANARQGFSKHYDTTDWNFRIVKSGDTLSLGRDRTLTFLEAPLLHWPDSMFTYLVEEKILFPNDAFGQHIASSQRFDDQLGKEETLRHAQKFFANLIIPLAPRVLKKLEEAGRLGIDIKMIAPSHGVIWRSYAADIVNAYVNWCKGVSKDKVTIVYDSMHGSTDAMAKAFAEGIMDEGVEVKVYVLKDGKAEGTHRSNIVPDILDSRAVLIGSPTLQNQMYPTVADFLSYLKGLEPGKLAQKKIGFAFGSHGGKGGAIKLVAADMRAAGIDVINEGFEVYYRPDEKELQRCAEMGRELARRVKSL
ncbi:FprA family A-type flavoprotein [Methanocella conradii]|uniref:FprA family A-type flavoprotein n=1 Tax=Methanocella conradii TaxID=1175444 RepID=UPI0024B3755F|nr:FprA family A-type flavoprotein [Methanocella conradii]MDI6896999.1 FprA family A-type flavoprotein [Methanocella conradii]